MFHVEQSHFRQLLAELSTAAGLTLDAEARELAERHALLLLAWNERMNLCAFADLEELVLRHFLEGFLAAELLPAGRPGAQLGVLDIGSGAGFPGLPIRAVRRDISLTLIESRGRKAAFLSLVAAQYPEPRPRVLAEELSRVHPEVVGSCVTLRGLQVPVEQLRARLAPGGRLITFPARGETDSESCSLRSAGFGVVARRSLPRGDREVLAWELHAKPS